MKTKTPRRRQPLVGRGNHGRTPTCDHLGRPVVTAPAGRDRRDRGTGALTANWSPQIEAHVPRDMVGTPPQLRSSCNLEAVRADATDTLLDKQTVTAAHQLTCPTTLLWAPRGILGDPPGLYDDARLDAAGVDRTRITVTRVDDVNHYSILMSAQGAATVANYIGKLS